MEKILTAREANDCQSLVDAIGEGRSSELVVRKGLDALVSLCESTEAHRVMFGMTLGGIPLLLEVMREHKGNENIARVGFLAVRCLACNEDIKTMVGESDGIPLLLEVLQEECKRTRQFKELLKGGGFIGFTRRSRAVGEQGCRALRSLLNNDDNKKRFAEAGGFEIILSMMEEHGASNAGVALRGCGALKILAVNADNKRKILAANGVSIVERMKLTWASNGWVQTKADGALCRLRYP